ncbi:m7GpppX diphosphatase [Erysiphe necator]|nr:m7GpppX diphosphatase [Erysiphe necator]
MNSTSTESKACQLLRLFQRDRVLSYDNNGLRVAVFGYINNEHAILILERAPFSKCPDQISQIIEKLSTIKNLGINDKYHWYVANTSLPTSLDSANIATPQYTYDLKINLLYPCTEQHIKKYTQQVPRMVIETPEIYREHVLPYITRQRESDSLVWIWNIIEGKTEVNDVIYRSPIDHEAHQSFLILPDLNWDRSTRENLHLLALPQRRDIWSIRDLKKKHVSWLRIMKQKVLEVTLSKYQWLEADQVKMYVHYQPTYYHFHIHIVHVAMEAGKTLVVGKAIGLESIIETLEFMGGSQEQGIEQMTLHYTIGEASELWENVFERLKAKSSDKGLPLR